MKLLGENMGGNKVNKWDCIKLKSPAKETNKMNRNLQNGRKYLQILYLIRG